MRTAADVQAALDAQDPFTVAVPGRMQLVSASPAAVVDFAHNPDALARALEAVRSPEPASKVIVVFGATGQRDQGKRPSMGAIAARLADVVIVSDDDPHDEDAAAIRADVLVGARMPRKPNSSTAGSWKFSPAMLPSGRPSTLRGSGGHHPDCRARARSVAGGQGSEPCPRRQGGTTERLDGTRIHRSPRRRDRVLTDMIELTAAEIADITNGRLLADPDVTPGSVVTDSREAAAGSLYVAKPGESADGHSFVGAAFDRGAVLALTEREIKDDAGRNFPSVVVEVRCWPWAPWRLRLSAGSGATGRLPASS